MPGPVVHCLQHVPFEGPGAYGRAFGRAGYRTETFLVPRDGLPPGPGDALLVMGGPMSVNDPEPWIARETEFVARAVGRGIPVLGVCLGSQLLAKALGGSVSPGPSTEVGVYRLELTEAGRVDPVLGPLGSPCDVLEWHGEGLRVPESCRVLAGSRDFPVQAFAHRGFAYGLLFHLELEADGLRALCEGCPGDLERAGTDGATVLADALPRLPAFNASAEGIVQRLVQRT